MPASPFSAALAVADEHGVPARDPRVVRDLTNLLVHLRPAPLIARVPLTFTRLRGREWFSQEVELARFLAAAGAPVAPPAADVDPGPHRRDGFLVTLWQYVDHDPERFDAASAGRALRDLHRALTAYPGELPRFDRLPEIARLLATIAPSEVVSEDELSALRDAHARLALEPVPAGQPIHGDSHFRNVLWSPDGPVWTDLENACFGPRELDVACLEYRRASAERETDAALAAYGEYDAALVERVMPFLALVLAAWTIVVIERFPTPGGRADLAWRIERARSLVLSL